MVSAQYAGLDLELTGGLLEHDVFGDERNNTIRYKTASDRFSWKAYNEYPGLINPQMSWQAVSVLMIAEIVSNGMLSLPQALAVVSYPGSLIDVLVSILAGSVLSLIGDRHGIVVLQGPGNLATNRTKMS
jgi:hypothetical protein